MFELAPILELIGHFGIFLIVFAESGVFLGFFLPGDSLLFTAGFLASQGLLDIRVLLVLTVLGAVLGDSFGYAFGRIVGPRIFRREDSFFFKREYIARTRAFYERHGGKAIIFARFFPVVRTFAPILAGVGAMRYATFLFYNIVGGALWAIGFTLLGFYLGNVIPNADAYILFIVAAIVCASFVPVLWHVARRRWGKRNPYSVRAPGSSPERDEP
ncbi:MAG: VTT domain-containing protein [Candidatus Liptonbacteria bacterium]|nr:VTT domain-containing protein [Candidatus Liptonbacteria bacterium]